VNLRVVQKYVREISVSEEAVSLFAAACSYVANFSIYLPSASVQLRRCEFVLLRGGKIEATYWSLMSSHESRPIFGYLAHCDSSHW